MEVVAHGENNLAITLTNSLQETGLNIDWKEKPDNGKPSIRIAVAASHLDLLLEQVNDQSLEDHVPLVVCYSIRWSDSLGWSIFHPAQVCMSPLL